MAQNPQEEHAAYVALIDNLAGDIATGVDSLRLMCVAFGNLHRAANEVAAPGRKIDPGVFRVNGLQESLHLLDRLKDDVGILVKQRPS